MNIYMQSFLNAEKHAKYRQKTPFPLLADQGLVHISAAGYAYWDFRGEIQCHKCTLSKQ